MSELTDDTKCPPLESTNSHTHGKYPFLFNHNRRRLASFLVRMEPLKQQCIRSLEFPDRHSELKRDLLVVRLRRVRWCHHCGPTIRKLTSRMQSDLLKVWLSFEFKGTSFPLDILFISSDLLNISLDQSGCEDVSRGVNQLELLCLLNIATKVCSLGSTQRLTFVPKGEVRTFERLESQLLLKMNFDIYRPTLKDALEMWMVLAWEDRLLKLTRKLYQRMVMAGCGALWDEVLREWDHNRLSSCILLWAATDFADELTDSPQILRLIKLLERIHAIIRPTEVGWSSGKWLTSAKEVVGRVGCFYWTHVDLDLNWSRFKAGLKHTKLRDPI